MRRDFDFVEMGDYQKDMGDLSSQASFIISEQRKEIDELKALVHCMVVVSGEIRLPRSDMDYLQKIPIEMFLDEYNYETIYRKCQAVATSGETE